MLKESLVYIRAAGAGETFVGCGAYIEENLVVTCRHVWRDAGEKAEAVFPHITNVPISALILIDACKGGNGDDPDVVLLRPADVPKNLTPLQIARSHDHECGQARALARLPTRKTDREIDGQIGSHIDEKGRGSFSQPIATGYWLERGSSGSPVFIGTGQQLAGLVSMAELGDEPQNAPIREAYVVPGTTIWLYVRALAQREFDERQRAIQRALLEERQADRARELIFEIARRSGADATATFDQALANARAAYDKGLDAIDAGERGGNLGVLVDNLLKRLAGRTRLGDFVGGSADAEHAFGEWERIEAERRALSLRAGIRILSEGARQDILRRDFRAAAGRYAQIIEIERPDSSARFVGLHAKYNELLAEGRDKGVNASLEVAVQLAYLEITAARNADERGAAEYDLGRALTILGGRESGAERLKEAVAAYRVALEERDRARVPLDWAATQHNLGLTLWRLGERESGTQRLEEAVAACRVALEERDRERVPLDWAATQNNLGLALATLGERESGTVHLEDAVAAYRAALEERTRERVPLDWAMTQNNLGRALATLGERESETARLQEAVAAYRAALEERTRDRVPLGWAATQTNLGLALATLGERESETTRLQEAVAASRAALEEYTRERVPLRWAAAQNNLGLALATLGERESGTAHLEDAVAAYRAALEERTRERAPLDWAATQNNLGEVLDLIARRGHAD